MAVYEILDKLISITETKKAAMEKILEITKNQRELINLGEISTLVNQISLKDRLMSDVDKMDAEFLELYRQLKKNLVVDSLDKIEGGKYPQLKDLQNLVVEIMNITKETKLIEDENIKKLEKDKGEISEKLKALKQGKRAVNAYDFQKNLSQSIFIDKKK